MSTFVAAPCPHCQNEQMAKRGKTARGTQHYLYCHSVLRHDCQTHALRKPIRATPKSPQRDSKCPHEGDDFDDLDR
jgi:hypothetical protein